MCSQPQGPRLFQQEQWKPSTNRSSSCVALQQLVDATQQANAAAQKSTGHYRPVSVDGYTQLRKTLAEAQRLADQASENAVEAKTGLA